MFCERENYLYCLRQLHTHVIEKSTQVAAYCLMLNHSHLLVDLAGLSEHRQSLALSYTKAINKRFYGWVPCFKGGLRPFGLIGRSI